MILFSLGGKSHAERDQVTMKIVSIWRRSSCSGNAVCLRSCERKHSCGEATWPKVYAAGSPWRFTDKSFDSLARTYRGRWPQHQWTWLWFLTVFLSSPSATSETSTTDLELGFRVVQKNSCLIISVDSIKQAWFILKTLDDVLIHLHAAILPIIIQQPWHNFCAYIPHIQIFNENVPKTILFHAELTCDYSNSQPEIAKHHRHYSQDVDLSPACWRPLAPEVIFHHFSTNF